MSREIKFRAWHNTVSHHYDVECFKADGSIVARRIVNGKVNYSALPAEDTEVEQYTGLKDGDGKDIYEGDIVKARWHRAKNARLDTEGEVKFDNGWFFIDDDPDGQDRLGIPIHNCYDIEVIGNIHENLELLKEKK